MIAETHPCGRGGKPLVVVGGSFAPPAGGVLDGQLFRGAKCILKYVLGPAERLAAENSPPGGLLVLQSLT
jgi:hypothetical protein